MFKPICFAVAFLFVQPVLAQQNITIDNALNFFGFTENQILQASDTITYYLRAYTTKPKNLVVFIQGTDPYPVFFFEKRKNGSKRFLKWFNDDYKTLDSTFTYAIIAKPGLSGIFDKDNFLIPEEYHKKNYKEYRVNQIHLAIEDIKEHHLHLPEKIIVYGHSEGAQIGANLAAINKSVTHLGFWSGNVLNNFSEFAMLERIAVLKGDQSDSIAHINIMKLVQWYQNILQDPLSTKVDQWGYTNRRWDSYKEAPLETLSKIDIPIYALFATEDESTPIETAYLLPLQFAQNKRSNLTFEVCIGCDHSYRERKNGKVVNHWNRLFEEFIDWAK